MGALWFLTRCSMRNRFRARIKRLKEPRYLIGLLAGIAYFYFMLWRPRPTPRGGNPMGMIAMMGRARLSVELAAAAILFVVAALAWIWPGRSKPALGFSRAEVQFLFPAPFTRPQLIRYRVLRTQFATFLGSAFMTLFFRPTSFASGWMFFVGVALVMAVINLHLTGVSLSRESLGAHGLAGLARQWLPVGAVVGAIGVIATAVSRDWSAIAATDSARAAAEEIQRVLSTGAAGVVLWPFLAVVRLPLAATPADFARALPWALLIILMNFVWVMRSDAAFEEASAELAEKVAKIRRGQPAARTPKKAAATPFTLSLDGRPEMAILWKNLILVGRYVSLKTLFRFVPLVVILGFAMSRGHQRGGLGALFGVLCVVTYIVALIMGPQIARNDLRQDLANLAVLKTWPIRGAALVRGQMLAPAAILISVAWLAALGGLVFGLRIDIPVRFVVAAILVAPGIVLMQVLVQNAIAVMWPSWVVIGSNRARGIDVMGQRLIMMAGLLVVLVLAVLPAALGGGLVALLIYWLTGSIAVIVPAAVAAVVLLVEAFLGSEIVGQAFERTDVSAIDATTE